MKHNYFIPALLVLCTLSKAQVNIVPASGGLNLSTAAYTTLGDIIISETAGSDIGGTFKGTVYFKLKIPNGYAFYVPTGVNDPFPITRTRKGADLFDFFPVSYTDTTLEFGIELFTNQGRLGDTLRISGLRVKAKQAGAPTGNIVWVPTSSSLYGNINLVGATMQVSNFGTLSTSFDTGLSEKETGVSISIYPNPATSFISVSAEQEISGIKIYNLQSALVQEQIVSNTSCELNIDRLSQGIYFIHTEMASGGTTVQKIFKY